MPGFTPLPHRPPSPPMQSVAAENGAMALERSLQFELQIRDQHIHQVEMDNVRLKVKLEEAEKDVRMATDMVMAACRSGNDTQQQAISPVKTMMASRAEEPRAATSALRARTATVEGGWGRTAAMDRVHDRGGYRYGSCFGGGWGDAGYRLRNGWGEFAESRDAQHQGWPRVGEEQEKMRGSSVPRVADPSCNGWGDGDRSMSGDCGKFAGSQACAQEQPESLLDLDENESTLNDGTDLNHRRPAWSTPAPLHPLTQFENVAKMALSDPFVTTTKGKQKTIDDRLNPTLMGKSRFRHLFPLDGDDDTEKRPFPEHSEAIAEDAYAEKQRDALTHAAIPDFVSAIPEVQFRERTDIRATQTDRWINSIHKRETSAKVSYPTTNDNKVSVNSGHFPTSGKEHKRHQVSSDSDPAVLSNTSRRFGGIRTARNGYDENFSQLPFRHNANKPAPRNVGEVRYVPAESDKNFNRTVVIYNLPPQTDIADIVARAGDAPLLSIKLLPTMGMKGRRTDGSIGVLETMTLLMAFFLDSSAEQFVFDATIEPLAIRGRTAVVKLLDMPTYPSGLDCRAYATAPGRLFSRRIRFLRPAHVPADRFDDILAGRSYGYKQPGWIVNMTMRKDASRQVITVEFASVEIARFAYDQIGWLKDFHGCEPRWVYDHEAGANGGRRGYMKTGDDEDSSDGEAFGDDDVQQVAMAALVNGLGSSRHAREIRGYDGVETAPAAPSFHALPRFGLPAEKKGEVELDF